MKNELNLLRWQKELATFAQVKSLLVLEHNIHDVFPFPWRSVSIAEGSLLKLEDLLHYWFREVLGYDQVVFYDQQHGFFNRVEPACCESFAQMQGLSVVSGCVSIAFHSARPVCAADVICRALEQRERSTVVILKEASRLIANAGRPERQESQSLANLFAAAQTTGRVMCNGVSQLNHCVILVDKSCDLPEWFYHSPNIKRIFVAAPDMHQRAAFLKKHFAQFFHADVYAEDVRRFTAEDLERFQERFVALTDGLLLTDLNMIRQISKAQKMRIEGLPDSAMVYRYGVADNPWHSLSPDRFVHGYDRMAKRVRGQRHALEKTVDVIKRAMLGLNGLQHSSVSKPKGVLVYAGPTGVGKTETAKALAELVFGDESACVRFDMSEYAQPHADQKLLGAPPGYVGYEVGGQLTNAIRANPFRILLFDEIEKAHPSVMDKFLQILEAGRLTDGQGNTVCFSESIIIFTTNLGVITEQDGERVANVTPDMAFHEVETKLVQALKEHFTITLGRPEILNRIGENIVVFDYIREDVAKDILESQIARITRHVEQNNHVRMSIEQPVKDFLLNRIDPHNGGRGIGAVVEAFLINPLSRWLFDHRDARDVVVRGVLMKDGVPELMIN